MDIPAGIALCFLLVSTYFEDVYFYSPVTYIEINFVFHGTDKYFDDFKVHLTLLYWSLNFKNRSFVHFEAENLVE